MGCRQQLFAPLPLLKPDPCPTILPQDTLRLQTDAANVLEGRVPIETFPKEYQEKIKNYYRFSATRYTSSNPLQAKRTTDTLDAI
jgi:hypothetical protein